MDYGGDPRDVAKDSPPAPLLLDAHVKLELQPLGTRSLRPRRLGLRTQWLLRECRDCLALAATLLVDFEAVQQRVQIDRRLEMADKSLMRDLGLYIFETSWQNRRTPT